MSEEEVKKVVKKKPKKKAPRALDSTRSRERERLAYEQDILRVILKHVDTNSEFYTVCTYDGGLLINKVVTLNIKSVNNRPTFQPYETENSVKISTLTIVEYGEFPDRPIPVHEIFKTGTPVRTIGSSMQVKEVLDRIPNDER